MKKRFLILFLVVTLTASFCTSVALAQDEAAVIDSAPSTPAEIANVDSSQNEPQAVESEPAEAIAEPVSEVQSEPIAEPVSEVQSEPIAEYVSEVQSEPIAESVIEVQSEPIAEPESVVQPEPTAESESEIQSEPTAEPESVVQPEPTAEPENVVQSEPTAEPESVVQPEPTAEPESVVQPEPTSEPENVVQPEPTEEAEVTPYSVEIGDYVLEGGTSVPLADILKELGYEGTIEAASFSNENLCAVENVDGVWMFQSKNAFSSVQTLTVTLDGVAYDIEVLDDNGKLIMNLSTGVDHDTLQQAINDPENETDDVRLKLLGNITGKTINIGDKKVTVDLNNYEWSNNIIERTEQGILFFINTASQAVTDLVNSVVAKITGKVDGNDAYYTSLADALESAGTTKTEIMMVGNETIEGNSGVKIKVDQDITLDLNGHTVQNAVYKSEASQVIKNNGILKIKDSSDKNKNGSGSGLLTNELKNGALPGDWNSNPRRNYATNVITNLGTLTVESGKIEQTANTSLCYVVDNNSGDSEASLTVNGGLLTQDSDSGRAVRMFCNSTKYNNIFTMNGGKSAGGYAGLLIQLPGSSSEEKLAQVNINGGTLEGEYAFYDTTGGDLFDQVRYKITGGILDGDVFSYGANINITGGTFMNDVAIKQTNPSDVTVSGGKFAADVYTYGDNATEKFISGGVFKNVTCIYDGITYDDDWLYEIIAPNEKVNNYDPETMVEYPYTVGIPVTVTFQDEQGNELQKNDDVKQGITLYNEFFKGELPTKPGYHFVRWEPEFAPLKGDTVYTPIFEKNPVTPSDLSEEEITPVVPMSSLAVTSAVYPDTEKETKITVPVKDKETVRVEATVSDTKATVSDISKETIDQLLSNENATKEVEIDCSDLPDMTIQKVEIKTDNLDMIARSEVESLKVSMDTGSIIMDKTAVNAIATLSNGATVVLVIEDIEDTSLNAAQKETVKAVDNLVVVIDSYILSETQKIRDFGEGKATLAFSQKILKNYMPDMLHVYELKPDGSKVEIMFRIVNGKIVFDINFLSTYIFVHD